MGRGSFRRRQRATQMMGSGGEMGSWLSARNRCALALAIFGLSAVAEAQQPAVTPAERESLVRLRTDRGGRAEEVDALLRIADEASANGLPAAPLTNKIREGLAKGADPKRIDTVV